MIDLGEKDITSLTIGDVKQMVEERSDLDKAEQKLWWRGYVLDNELLPITKACMGAYFIHIHHVEEVMSHQTNSCLQQIDLLCLIHLVHL